MGWWVVSEPLIPQWDAAMLPFGFTVADGVAIMAIECGASLAQWQFDWLAAVFEQNPDGTYRIPRL